ncbi:hypothetical protein MUK42_33836 [Musa troglodytarum]|uniref:Uncharacterized protein n=1 Tax=Musa troglodytarum TaxID=320322 RepID=A0A9E7EDZ6_9LILI|nr:hypothetical protein MUK42_33836 [Musa troglodytarum]
MEPPNVQFLIWSRQWYRPGPIDEALPERWYCLVSSLSGNGTTQWQKAWAVAPPRPGRPRRGLFLAPNKSLAKVIQIERERILRENLIKIRLKEKPYGHDNTMPVFVWVGRHHVLPFPFLPTKPFVEARESRRSRSKWLLDNVASLCFFPLSEVLGFSHRDLLRSDSFLSLGSHDQPLAHLLVPGPLRGFPPSIDS